MSTMTPDRHVADLVLEEPGRARVFERLGIDYCCGGRTPLAAACAERGLDVDAVVAALEDTGPSDPEDIDWADASIEDLVEHIVDQHHAYLREELPPLGALVEKVARAHGDVHPELLEVEETFAEVRRELDGHMEKEEQVLFPACTTLASGVDGRFPFDSVSAPIGAMLHEHDEVAALLSRLRQLTAGYEAPADACNSYRALLDRLETLERDTHRHVHEENNILFPRALALEVAR